MNYTLVVENADEMEHNLQMQAIESRIKIGPHLSRQTLTEIGEFFRAEGSLIDKPASVELGELC